MIQEARSSLSLSCPPICFRASYVLGYPFENIENNTLEISHRSDAMRIRRNAMPLRSTRNINQIIHDLIPNLVHILPYQEGLNVAFVTILSNTCFGINTNPNLQPSDW